jgi:hypothetical protein
MWELYLLILGTFLRSLWAFAGIIGTLFSGSYTDGVVFICRFLRSLF